MKVEYVDGLPTNSHWTWDTTENGKPIVTVDFDHTITTLCGACTDNGDSGTVQPKAIEVLEELSKKYKIYIFTGRKRKEDFDYIFHFLMKNKIPFDKIIMDKPYACFMIDDRAIHHKGWDETLKEIKRREKNNGVDK